MNRKPNYLHIKGTSKIFYAMRVWYSNKVVVDFIFIFFKFLSKSLYADMIPYGEPYQSMYQQRRLGALGIDWQPLRVNLAVGIDDVNHVALFDHALNFHPNFHGSPVDNADDGERWVEQPADADEEMDWEQDMTKLSDDSGSDYSISEEILSLLDDDEHTASSTEVLEYNEDEEDGDAEESAEDAELRRSKRNKRKTQVRKLHQILLKFTILKNIVYDPKRNNSVYS